MIISVEYILRTLVYIQSFFWLYVLFSNWKIKDYRSYPIIQILFISTGIVAYFQIIRYDISFSQYTSNLLSFYVLMVLLCFGFFYSKYSFKDSVSLAFLIVFINSYYWESMFHLNAIIFYGLSFNQIVQMFHLIPAYFLVRRIEFYNPRKVIKLILYGVIVSGSYLTSSILISYITITRYGRTLGFILTPIVRLITLGILINIVLNEVKEIKKGVEKN